MGKKDVIPLLPPDEVPKSPADQGGGPPEGVPADGEIGVGQPHQGDGVSAAGQGGDLVLQHGDPGGGEGGPDIGVLVQPGLVVAGDVVDRGDLHCLLDKVQGGLNIGVPGIHQVPGDDGDIRPGPRQQL